MRRHLNSSAQALRPRIVTRLNRERQVWKGCVSPGSTVVRSTMIGVK